MAGVSFGGGPTLAARRSFAGFKDGTHTPGYGGYCPHLKYRCGKTFGQNTHELAQFREHVHPVSVTDAPESFTLRRSATFSLPESQGGDIKYCKDIIPGYNGYVPKSMYKHGDTYTTTCNLCVSEMVVDKQKMGRKDNEMLQLQNTLPSLKPVVPPDAVKATLDSFKDQCMTKKPALLSDRVSLTEPRVPGYVGYIPRLKPTESGLGMRYWTGTKNSLDLFAADQQRARNRSQTAPEFASKSMAALSVPRFGRSSTELQDPTVSQPNHVINKRIYVPPGMIPSYTGYCPQYMYRFGNTYGDTTRKLEVCAHDQTCYGDVMKAKVATNLRFTVPA